MVYTCLLYTSIGVEGEENQGLCTGSENYWCVNKNAAPEDIQATLDFLNWVVTVSYTHLDVYKRQPASCIRMILPAWAA